MIVAKSWPPKPSIFVVDGAAYEGKGRVERKWGVGDEARAGRFGAVGALCELGFAVWIQKGSLIVRGARERGQYTEKERVWEK